MSSDAFRDALAELDGPLQALMRRYAEAMFTQLARNAACNRVHQVRQRAARWLLMTADRMDSGTFELTQEFLARMLAVRRPSVNEVAQTLATDGAIRYTRGVITILDRERLQATACGCYDVIRQATKNAFPPGRH
jgi:CRP-like cAMP-binding protein